MKNNKEYCGSCAIRISLGYNNYCKQCKGGDMFLSRHHMRWEQEIYAHIKCILQQRENKAKALRLKKIKEENDRYVALGKEYEKILNNQ